MRALRPIQESRSLQPIREFRDNYPVSTDLLGKKAHEFAKDLYVPMIRRRETNAIHTDPKYFYLYQKLLTGRRCSCFVAATGPTGKCPICHQQGVVGGFVKYGTNQVVVDVTYPNTILVNIHPNYEEATRPNFFILDDNALIGYIQARINLNGSYEHLDLFQTIASRMTNTAHVVTNIKTHDENTFVEATLENIEARLPAGKLDFQVILSRSSRKEKSPVLSHIFVRWMLMNDLRVLGDVDRFSESRTLGELGYVDQLTTINANFDSQIANFTTEDWLYRIDQAKRWKFIEVKPNKPLDQLTSWDCTLRVIFDYESYSSVPI